MPEQYEADRLAFHNYHDALGHFPSWGFDFPSNPNPSNPYGPQTQGHSSLTMILAYIEQAGLANITRSDRSVIDPINLPPPLPGANNPGGGTQISVFMCPSVQERTADYGPYFSEQFGQTLPAVLLGVTDYTPIRGINGTFRTNCAPNTPSGAGTGALGAMSGRPRLTDIIDGTSNTILLAETAGRQQVWRRGRSIPGVQVLNAAWADYNTSYQLVGYDQEGVTRNGGCAAVNASNDQALYAMHPGGVNICRADGSLTFLRENVEPVILAAVISRAGNEVLPGDLW